jgi:hypothetical protein
MILEERVTAISGHIVDICILGLATGALVQDNVFTPGSSRRKSTHEVPTLNTGFREAILRHIYN